MSDLFKKTCFGCGEKIDRTYRGKCESCFIKENPPIKELKSINLKICNACKKIHYSSTLISIDELKEILPAIIEKNLILNNEFSLKTLKINDFKIDSNKLSFDIKVDCDLN